ncbi:MAG: PrsW family intramembrane metalloprotease [Lachnospiraceae bacterium]|nr:PrsW family intramembrane metalloprotease [Lachnospiraceae bacterium]
MNYIENIYVCLAVPLLIAAICSLRKTRQLFLFFLAGMTACLLSSYISTFLAASAGAGQLAATLTITPPVEEFMKLFPFLFYLLVFEPKKEQVSGCMLMIAAGFATFENVCYLTQNGASSLLHLLIRGFGAGAMHVACGAILAGGMILLWDRIWLRLAGAVGLLSVAITYHGIYNILVSQQGAAAIVGYLFPVVSVAAGVILIRRLSLLPR